LYEIYRNKSEANRLKNQLTKKGRQLAFKQLLVMGTCVFIYALISYFSWGYVFAKSVLIGGAVAIVPNIFFAVKAFMYAGAKYSHKVLSAFYSGEKYKIVLTAILFALTFKFIAIEPIAFFTSFCLVALIPLLAPFYLNFNH
jgi:ATP synthase protein I